MSVYAGVVTSEHIAPNPGIAQAMLSQIIAPHHRELNCIKDAHIDIASRHRAGEAGLYEDADMIVVADGRPDPSPSLRQQLALSDNETNPGKIIALAYKQRGESLVDETYGEFAFAIWEKKDRSLFCARDRFGQTPFAYMLTSAGIMFSSDFLAIAANASTPLSVNDSWIVGYLNAMVTDEDGTPFSDIMRLPPASTLKWVDGDLSIRKYWSFAEIGPTSNEIEISDVSKALEASVADRMSVVNCATMLSGGLDSSSITVLARDIRQARGGKPLSSVSLVFDDFPDESERPYIESVVEQGGLDSHFVNVQSFDLFSVIERLVRTQGAPTIARGAPIFDQAISTAEQIGVTSVLDGHGGDEVISSFGVMRLYELANEGKWLTLLRELVRVSNASDLNLFTNFAGLYSAKGRGPVASLFRKIYSKMRAPRDPDTDASLLRQDWQKHPVQADINRLNRRSNPVSHTSERSFHETILSAPLQSHAFEFLHRQFRSRGIRPEFPYWDFQVVALCLRVPSHEKLKDGVPRSLIRSILGNRLPPLVANRTTKFDFSDFHIRSMQSSLGRLNDLIETRDHKVYEYVDRNVFASAVAQLRDDDRHTRVQASTKVWTVLNLILWLDMVASFKTQNEYPSEPPC